MNAYMVRRALAACAVTGSMLLVPAESQAIFHWFGGCGSCGTTANRPVATYAPVAPPVVTNPCVQTCNYVPQTCYRTVFQQVPVTTYQPVAACGPCGQQVTAMRPVVTYQTQARLVPYTTYRPVYGTTVGYAPAVASPCATGACGGTPVSYAPAMPVAPATSGCSSCTGSSAPVTYSAPATSTYASPSTTYASPSQSYVTPMSPSNGIPGSNVPSLANPPASSPASSSPRTFEKEDSSVTEPESRLKPIPDDSTHRHDDSMNRNTNSTLQPRLLDTDRTTYRELKHTAPIIPVSAQEPVDNGGWRAARQ